MANSWEKKLGNFFAVHERRSFQIQVSKLLKLLLNAGVVPRPLKIRNRLEDALCDLVENGAIKSWRYREIDEDLLLECKNWFYYWKQLSIKVLL